jgi:hypothetical protein
MSQIFAGLEIVTSQARQINARKRMRNNNEPAALKPEIMTETKSFVGRHVCILRQTASRCCQMDDI